MVSLRTIQTSNTTLTSLPPGLTGVFFAPNLTTSTSNITLATLKAFARHANAPKSFIIGCSQSKAGSIIDELKEICPMGTFEFVDMKLDMGGIGEVDRVCVEIEKLAERVDFLCIDTPLSTRTDTRLNNYYSSQRLLTNLLPLLSKSLSPRVIIVSSIRHEEPLKLSDLSDEQTVSLLGESPSISTMRTLSLEEFATEYPTISFIHYFSGWMGHSAPGSWYFPTHLVKYCIAFPLSLMGWFSASIEEAGERVLFLATSERFPPAKGHDKKENLAGWAALPEGVPVARATVMKEGKGNGVYRVGWDGESLSHSKVLDKEREKGLGRGGMLRRDMEREWERERASRSGNDGN